MRLRLLIQEKARTEWHEGAAWYDRQEAELGLKFNIAVRRVLRTVANDPRRFRLISQRIRKARIHGWPYSIYFVFHEASARILVVAIWHERRNPALLKARIRS